MADSDRELLLTSERGVTNIPSVRVQSLDLSNNRLKSLDGFKDLAKETSNLKHIKISNNQLRAVEELDKIKSLSQLQTIALDGNPLCDIFQDKQSSYTSAIRSRFPKVTSLSDAVPN
ncbi:nuclear RNA export factor 1-like [Stylophora pistillata]|uniref:nuclear RNA export factor 1-like n=1 Tax=Stylophora pistillata TaxID=50429 RepID=UPI000C045AC1|nr:nuclear RNA export factor 1-like [Stylophora pistillata]